MKSRLSRHRRSCRRRLSCLFIIILLGLMAICGLLFTLTTAVYAQPAQRHPLAITLLIDNSHSMFVKNGIGSDPHGLRLVAARSLLQTITANQPEAQSQFSIIFFGTQATTAVPFTPLTTATLTDTLAPLTQPPNQGWTDHLVALQHAQQLYQTANLYQRPILILITDGKPEWPTPLTVTEQANYIANLRQYAQDIKQQGGQLVIVLLANQVTDADPDIQHIWQPLWAEIAHGGFFVVRQATDLPQIYADMGSALKQDTIDLPQQIGWDNERQLVVEPLITTTPSLPLATAIPTELVTLPTIITVPPTIFSSPSPPTISLAFPLATKFPQQMPPASPNTSVSQPISPLLFPLTIVIIGTVAGRYYWLRAVQPHVTGILRLQPNPTYPQGQLFDLDAQCQPRLTIGIPPAMIPISHCQQRITVRPGQLLHNTFEMILESDTPIILDGQSQIPPIQLHDNARIELQPNIQLIYENLPLHRAQQQTSQLIS